MNDQAIFNPIHHDSRSRYFQLKKKRKGKITLIVLKITELIFGLFNGENVL